MTTYDRRVAADLRRLIPRTDDPPAEAGRVLVYSRTVDGVLRTLARFSNGSVRIIL
ncbi:MAG TPA: hypothetical protein VFD36_20440 [Kofleriaceae bacterium]|nr:hypothetical protein [Kofleriaceae bacterium]